MKKVKPKNKVKAKTKVFYMPIYTRTRKTIFGKKGTLATKIFFVYNTKEKAEKRIRKLLAEDARYEITVFKYGILKFEATIK